MWLVRHARAGDRTRWEADDRLRPLSPSGRRQAESLGGHLAGHGLRDVGAVLSSEYLRCVETVAPLAVAAGLEVAVSRALAEGASPAAALELVGSCGTAVLCSHGDVIGEVVMHLAHRGILRGGLDCQKASTWVLTVTDGEISGARYVAPPA